MLCEVHSWFLWVVCCHFGVAPSNTLLPCCARPPAGVPCLSVQALLGPAPAGSADRPHPCPGRSMPQHPALLTGLVPVGSTVPSCTADSTPRAAGCWGAAGGQQWTPQAPALRVSPHFAARPLTGAGMAAEGSGQYQRVQCGTCAASQLRCAGLAQGTCCTVPSAGGWQQHWRQHKQQVAWWRLTAVWGDSLQAWHHKDPIMLGGAEGQVRGCLCVEGRGLGKRQCSRWALV